MGKGAMDKFLSMDDLLNPEVDYGRPPRGGDGLFDLLGDLEGKRILDLGCGTGTYRRQLVDRGAEWIGVDLSGPVARVIADAGELPFPDDAFEGILCSAVLEHLPEPDVLLHEARRVLKPSGLFFGYVAFLEPFHGMSYFHMTHMGTEYLLRKHGLKPRRIFPSHVGMGYQLELLLFPRRVPIVQPAFRWMARRIIGAFMAANRGVRLLLFLLFRRAAARDPEDRRKYRQLLALKFSIGFNFIAVKEEIPPSGTLGYRALVKEG